MTNGMSGRSSKSPGPDKYKMKRVVVIQTVQELKNVKQNRQIDN